MKFFIAITFLLISGCTYYAPLPGTAVYANPGSKFDSAWSAAIGAFADQGIIINTQDRGAGVIQGKHMGNNVSADLRKQADGSIRVQFDTSNNPELIKKISRSYNSRMGR